MTESLTAQLKQAARDHGADLAGIAPMERFEGVDRQRHPQSIFPEARSVIVLGKRITRGCLRGVEEGTQFGLYRTYGVNCVSHRFLASTTVAVSEFLEDRRWEAVPLPNVPPEAPPMGIPVRVGSPAPNVLLDFIDAAVRAGLGEIGLAGELMTPAFGPLQRLQVILTDAPLEGNPLVAPGSVCDHCGRCADICPLKAIDARNVTERTICGSAMPVAAIDHSRCLRCRNGAVPNDMHARGLPDKLAALCMRTCLHHLGEAGRLTNPWRQPFRSRPAWAVDDGGQARIVEDRT